MKHARACLPVVVIVVASIKLVPLCDAWGGGLSMLSLGPTTVQPHHSLIDHVASVVVSRARHHRTSFTSTRTSFGSNSWYRSLPQQGSRRYNGGRLLGMLDPSPSVESDHVPDDHDVHAPKLETDGVRHSYVQSVDPDASRGAVLASESGRNGSDGEDSDADGGSSRKGNALDKQLKLFVEMSTPFFKVKTLRTSNRLSSTTSASYYFQLPDAILPPRR